jgi:hypothetical protein
MYAVCVESEFSDGTHAVHTERSCQAHGCIYGTQVAGIMAAHTEPGQCRGLQEGYGIFHLRISILLQNAQIGKAQPAFF